ncbi:MAG: sigma-70 family RNA polymerase sigma factor [Marinilabiliaceae bacterium]|nr:sigma-70 family RNA polymerase sigma factor [Marinilabiliaceae bacterium]
MHKVNTFKAKGKFDAWLRKITVNTALMHIREIKHENKQEIISHSLVNNYEDKGMWKEFTVTDLFFLHML